LRKLLGLLEDFGGLEDLGSLEDLGPLVDLEDLGSFEDLGPLKYDLGVFKTRRSWRSSEGRTLVRTASVGTRAMAKIARQTARVLAMEVFMVAVVFGKVMK
jgi:hypothetical protein